MNINQIPEGSKLTLQLAGKLDMKSAPDMEKVLRTALDGVTELVIDLAETVYISSAGLRVLLIAQKQMNKQGSMKIIHVTEDVRAIFEVTGFTEVMTVL